MDSDSDVIAQALVDEAQNDAKDVPSEPVLKVLNGAKTRDTATDDEEDEYPTLTPPEVDFLGYLYTTMYTKLYGQPPDGIVLAPILGLTMRRAATAVTCS